MRDRLTLRLYCAAVFAVGLALVGVLAGSAHFGYLGTDPLTFGVLAAAVILGEMLPVKIPRRGGDEEITLSTSFSMALLLAGGLGPAVIAQAVASVIQDTRRMRAARHVRMLATSASILAFDSGGK